MSLCRPGCRSEQQPTHMDEEAHDLTILTGIQHAKTRTGGDGANRRAGWRAAYRTAPHACTIPPPHLQG